MNHMEFEMLAIEHIMPLVVRKVHVVFTIPAKSD